MICSAWARNARLVAEIEAELAAAAALSQSSGKPARRFKDFTWRTRDRWSRERRVVAKAESTGGEANPRFVVTSLARGGHEGRRLYEKLYCARGEMENRINSLPSRKRGSASSTCSPTAPLFRPGAGSRPGRCAPTSCGCGSPRWPMSWVRAARYCPCPCSVRPRHLRHDPPRAVEDRRSGMHQRAPHQARHALGLPLPGRVPCRPCRSRRRQPLIGEESGNINPKPRPKLRPPIPSIGVATDSQTRLPRTARLHAHHRQRCEKCGLVLRRRVSNFAALRDAL